MECDAMSIDVTFEEIEQTALKFALAEFQGSMSADHSPSIMAINENAINMAIEWHSGKTKRLEVFYSDLNNRKDWIKKQYGRVIKQDIDNINGELIKHKRYWVMPHDTLDDKPIYAEFISYDGDLAEFTIDGKFGSFYAKEIKTN